ncbi:MAG: hypothetical protein IPO30_20535 [Hyphomonadaceae bacterium]|nr:hypothetical protein [Hyphomonadaceae bacterium]
MPELKLRTPYNVFIGGQILTGASLSPTCQDLYYGRSPKKMQQDTVLQHARMYGARRRQDLAVTRLYTTASNHAALRRIHQFDSALRDAFMKGAHDRGSPSFSRTSVAASRPAHPAKFCFQTLLPCAPARPTSPWASRQKPGRRLLAQSKRLTAQCPRQLPTQASRRV